MKLITTLTILTFFVVSCKKELPEPHELNNSNLSTSSATIIPCESDLVSNHYSVGSGISFGGYNSFDVYTVNGTESFDDFKINANHYETNVNLHIHVSGKPNSFIGRRIYTTSPLNHVSGNKAKCFVSIGTTTSFNPIDVDTIFVDYYNDSMVYSFCDVELKSSQSGFSTTTLRLKGRVVYNY